MACYLLCSPTQCSSGYNGARRGAPAGASRRRDSLFGVQIQIQPARHTGVSIAETRREMDHTSSTRQSLASAQVTYRSISPSNPHRVKARMLRRSRFKLAMTLLDTARSSLAHQCKQSGSETHSQTAKLRTQCLPSQTSIPDMGPSTLPPRTQLSLLSLELAIACASECNCLKCSNL